MKKWASLHVSEEKAPQKSQRPGRIVSGAGRIVNGGRPKFMRLPKSTPSPEELANQRKRTICQREIAETTVNLVKSTLGKLAKDENHAKKCKKEIGESTAVGPVERASGVGQQAAVNGAAGDVDWRKKVEVQDLGGEKKMLPAEKMKRQRETEFTED